HHREARVEVARDLRELRAVLVRGDGLDRVAAVAALEQIDGAHSDRSGGAEDGHGAHRLDRPAFGADIRINDWHHSHHPMSPPPGADTPLWAIPIRTAASATVTNPSRRSIRPP